MGYKPSIVQRVTDERCFICGRCDGKLDRHEIFHGAYRERSKEFGLWVTLCHPCHMALHHMGRSCDCRLKRIGQKAAMEKYKLSIQSFRTLFGKNYL